MGDAAELLRQTQRMFGPAVVPSRPLLKGRLLLRIREPRSQIWLKNMLVMCIDALKIFEKDSWRFMNSMRGSAAPLRRLQLHEAEQATS